MVDLFIDFIDDMVSGAIGDEIGKRLGWVGCLILFALLAGWRGSSRCWFSPELVGG